MTILYNCRHAGDQYRITKFDDHMNVESSYLTDGKDCDCPAGVRPTCRHRAMLPEFIFREHIGDEWFLDYDRGGWVQMGLEYAAPEPEEPEGLDEGPSDVEGDSEALQSPNPSPEPDLIEAYSAMLGKKVTAVHEGVPIVECGELPPLPKGIVMMTLDDPAALHNAIAEAVGEPEAIIERPKAVFIRRRI